MEQIEMFPEVGLTKERLLRALVVAETRDPTTRIRSPQDTYCLLAPWADAEQEHFLVITVNGAHHVVKTHVITKGLVNRTLVHPREVFRPALKDNAVAIITAHNHPSGQTVPSDEDHQVCGFIRDAGDTLGIRLLDNIVFSTNGWTSFLEEGWL